MPSHEPGIVGDEADLLRARERGWTGATVEVQQGGRPWGTLRHNFWRDSAQITVGDETFTVHAEGFLREHFRLCRGQEVLARANRRGVFRFGYWIEHAGRRWSLRPARVFSQRAIVGTGEMEAEVGWLKSKGFFGLTTVARLPAAMPAAVQAFTLWLTLLMWRRRKAAA